jgi:hypothetical protein
MTVQLSDVYYVAAANLKCLAGTELRQSAWGSELQADSTHLALVGLALFGAVYVCKKQSSIFL